MEKSKLIIVEGPQGTGKSTLANGLRSTMASTYLHSLSGHKDKTQTGLQLSIEMYDIEMDYLRNLKRISMNHVYDRIFTSEEVYARLGFKEYSFTDEYKRYCEELNRLAFDIYYLNLYLGDPKLYEQRLNNRGEHHQYQAFSGESSMRQEEMYGIVANELKQYDNINVFDIKTDISPIVTLDELRKLIRIKE